MLGYIANYVGFPVYNNASSGYGLFLGSIKKWWEQQTEKKYLPDICMCFPLKYALFLKKKLFTIFFSYAPTMCIFFLSAIPCFHGQLCIARCGNTWVLNFSSEASWFCLLSFHNWRAIMKAKIERVRSVQFFCPKILAEWQGTPEVICLRKTSAESCR